MTTVIDAEGEGTKSLDALDRRETVVIVELSTMEVVWRAQGSVLGVGTSSASDAIDEALIRLGDP